jgi:nucleotide-binding universal stress UspA family protein
MEPKDLLVHLDSGARAPERLRLAVALARRHAARLTGLFAESPTLGTSLLGKRDPGALAQAAAGARARFEAACGDAGVATRFWQLGGGEVVDVVDAAVICCRRVDLAVFGQQHGDDAPVPEGLVERVIAGSGRPVLVVPSFGTFPETGRRVLVAWTGSREAARALHDALPLLERAESVVVLALQSPTEGADVGGLPPVDLVDHLRTHGIEASYDRWVVGDLSGVDAVLNRASDEGADLTVIGAYGLLGGGPLGERHGMTKAILETMTTPVLLSC